MTLMLASGTDISVPIGAELAFPIPVTDQRQTMEITMEILLIS